jgi:hypothetical protein
MEFDDDNTRLQAFLSWQRRLVNRPYFKLPVTLELYGSGNSAQDRPYFNPEQDLSATVMVDLRWLLYRRYQRTFAHHLAVTGGTYWQKDFGAGPVGSLRYEHDWHLNDDLTLQYGIIWRRRIYDGDSETNIWTYLNCTWRF